MLLQHLGGGEGFSILPWRRLDDPASKAFLQRGNSLRCYCSANNSFLMPADAAGAQVRHDTPPRARMQLEDLLHSILPLKANLSKGENCFKAGEDRINTSACQQGHGRPRRQADPRPRSTCSRFSRACRRTCPRSRDAVFPPLWQCRLQQLPAAAKRYF